MDGYIRRPGPTYGCVLCHENVTEREPSEDGYSDVYGTRERWEAQKEFYGDG